MISHSETRMVPYPAELMYAVVSDVEKYPEFLPFCEELKVLRQVESGDRLLQLFESPVFVGMDRKIGGGRRRQRQTIRARSIRPGP